MRKIPTIFRRNPDDLAHLLDEVTPGCEWVFAGAGTATRKLDGTCVMIRRDALATHAYARRTLKPGRVTPPGFLPIETDPETGIAVGWQPAALSPLTSLIDQAVEAAAGSLMPGTYELVGPRINGNPEGYDTHTLVPHASMNVEIPNLPNTLQAYEALMLDIIGPRGWEGIVWHHPDGRMGKLKVRDFR